MKTMGKKLVLLVEDHQDVASVIFDYFEDSDLEFDYAATGAQGYELASKNQYDCIILDVMLPVMDVFEVCKLLRSQGINTGIIMLTARDTRDDMLSGLTQGADDYVVKPFDLELLEARIHAVIRRTSGQGFSTEYHIGDVCLNQKEQQAYRQSKPLNLTPTCYKILKMLCEKYPETVSREMILRELWPDDPPDQDILRKHIYQLRNQLDKPFDDPVLLTVPKTGYRLNV